MSDSQNLTPDSTSITVPAPEATTLANSNAEPVVTFAGNNYDLMAVVGVTVGGIVLLSCATCNMGFYCLPLVPIVLGVVGLISAKDSVNPERTRLLSWLSVGSGGVILLLLLLFIAAYIFIIFFAIAADKGGF